MISHLIELQLVLILFNGVIELRFKAPIQVLQAQQLFSLLEDERLQLAYP